MKLIPSVEAEHLIYTIMNIPSFLPDNITDCKAMVHPKSDIAVMTGWFEAQSYYRNLEYQFCLKKNLENKFIKKIVLFKEPGELPQFVYAETWDKLQIVEVETRPTYQQYVNFANKHLRNNIVMLANRDIYFDDSLSQIKQSVLKNKAYALARWNMQEDGSLIFWQRNDAQDAWCWLTPCDVIGADFSMGSPGCDNRFAAMLSASGFTVSNPSKVIKCVHVHMSQDRTSYGQRVKGPIKTLVPTDQL